MDTTKAFSPTPSLSLMRDRVLPNLAIAYQLIVLLAFLAIPILAISWLGTPFLGGFVDNNLIFNSVQPTIPGSWEAYHQGVQAGDALVAIAGTDVYTSEDIRLVLHGFSFGDPTSLTIRTPSGDIRTINITLQPFPTADRQVFLLAAYFVGFAYLVSSIWVASLRRGDAAGQAFSYFGASVALLVGGLFDVNTTQQLTPLWSFGVAMVGGSLVHMAFVFPSRLERFKRISWIPWVTYLFSFGLALNAWLSLGSGDSARLAAAWQAEFVYITAGMVIFLGGTGLRRYTSRSPISREQTRLVLLGTLAAFTPFILWVASSALQLDMSIYGSIPLLVVILPLSIFPLAIAYSILRYRLLNTDYMLSRAFLYAALTILAGVGYALVVSGLSLIFGGLVDISSPFVIGVLVFLLAMLFNPLRVRLQTIVDELFFRGQSIFREQLRIFSSQLTQNVDLADVENLVRGSIEEYYLPTRLHLFILDPLSDYYTASPDANGQNTTDIRFPRNSGIVRLLNKQNTLYIDDSFSFPSSLNNDKTRLSLLGTQLFIALPGQEHLTGWLALGPRRSGEAYNAQDLNFLTALSEQAALAVERAQVLADKDRRVHEMNVLTRVAQGVNITLDFDDILELIYAQTTQVIPTTDFSITLYNLENGSLKHAFYIVDDDRISEMENVLLEPNQGLEAEVIKTSRTIITPDYATECRSLGNLPAREDVFAWMSSPLKAGTETVGVISIGNRDPSLVYTLDQGNLLEAIADQASGAIVKARLLDESEKRARQLATLNEVTRNLSSTLEIDPLLNTILASAVTILNCEGGSLLLLEEETGELVFEIVAGPVAEDLIGTRLEPGVGFVGKSVESRQPLMHNAAEQNHELDHQSDEDTGDSTRGLMVVPMMIQDRVIGVIEVINKNDLTPFNNEDLELLIAFTGQAAIAIENARLYTLTDQKLASRVEELSVLQRVDRELNTSLDVGRAMEITLDWAMRQSEANAGLIGVVQEDGIHIMASQGYTTELDAYQDDPLPLQMPGIAAAIESGRPEELNPDQLLNGATLLPGTRSQLVIPIRREADVIGLLFLESSLTDSYSEDSENFLTRLCDHAAIAISNAQLYAEVQRANIAKSDFVSFVSHELKTPMTSIKGYADLLAAGSVGPINEAQEDFLTTIRSNVGRMATLVSDLADISQIEAGKLHLEYTALPIGDVIQDVIHSTRTLIDDKQQKLELDIPENLPQAWGDRNRIIQILTNLVSNATKYTPEGNIIIIRARQTANKWDPDSGTPDVIHIAVVDNGIGIKEEDQKNIFTQYFRTDKGKETAPGTGLGLNISRTLVEMQGGTIWFESEFGKGTTFHFTLPITELGLN